MRHDAGRFAQIYRCFYHRIFINPILLCGYICMLRASMAFFGKEKLENFLEVGLKLNLNSKLPRVLHTHKTIACLASTIFYLTKFSIYSCQIILIFSTINMLENLSNSTHDDAHKLDKT